MEKIVRQKMGKVSLAVIITSILILSCANVDEYINMSKKLSKDFDESAAFVSERLTSSLGEPLWMANEGFVRAIIRSEMKDKRVYAVIVRDSPETVFCAEERDDNWKIIRSEGNISGDFVVRKENIIYEEKSVGLFEICFTTRFAEEELRNLRVYMAGKVLFMSISLVSVILFIVKFLLVKPVSELIRGMSVVGTEVGSAVSRLSFVAHQEHRSRQPRQSRHLPHWKRQIP
ncbi:MAG: hypothetical protein DRI57_06815 [Deltaproteobacteria bacterium]|nr:MAG: hypothetical protein DRI57_06815 [Deltaproteobacteria bacterium]